MLKWCASLPVKLFEWYCGLSMETEKYLIFVFAVYCLLGLCLTIGTAWDALPWNWEERLSMHAGAHWVKDVLPYVPYYRLSPAEKLVRMMKEPKTNVLDEQGHYLVNRSTTLSSAPFQV
eukprot:gb/GECG01001371.1/.p1 GENE.gb/GECG01001371.1/~~gb/GECG01001371.1/.p1  ORF type:complete len:119 (+),score=9.51 gb/GECG01001371.1/:1-357(+)